MEDVVVLPGGALPPDFADGGDALVALLDNSDGLLGHDAAAAHADPLAGGWVHGARVVVFVAGVAAFRAIVDYAESPAPGTREAALVLAGAAALVAYAAQPGGLVPGEDLDAAAAAWIRRGARVMLLHATATASQAAQLIDGFAPGTTAMVRLLTAAGALLANLARPQGIHGDSAHRCAAWLRAALLVLYIATAVTASVYFLSTFAPRN